MECRACRNRERLKARHRLVSLQARKQFGDGAGLPGQDRLGRNLGQWLQNKPAFLKTRMRKCELRPWRCSSLKAMRSRSSGRGSFMTTLGCRPNCTSSACNFSNNDSGVSLSNGVNAAVALMKSGESGGQSTGVLRHREDCEWASGKAFSIRERPIEAWRLDRRGWSQAQCRRAYSRPRTFCMFVKPGRLPLAHWAARRAPLAKVSRLAALCVSSSRSPAPAYMTV